MHKPTEISLSSPSGAASPSSVNIAPPPWDSRDETLGKWRAGANAPVFHVTVKRPFWRLDRNLQLTAQLLLSALAVAFVLLRCYRQVVVVNSPGKEPGRSLAEGEGSGRELPCWGAALEGNQPLAGASDDDVERAIQQRTEDVLRRLVQVTKDCSSVAISFPAPYTMKIVDLFMGFCIQEVAALSSLLGESFDKQKAEVLRAATDSADRVRQFSRKRDKQLQMLHATRLMQMANRLSTEEAENPPLAGEVRSQMLEDLLKLQEAALELLEAATSSVLNSGGPVREITVEIINEFTEEMKRVVYVRREQVFTSRHLSHRLRSLEAERNRGLLVRRWNMENMDRKPEKSLKSKLAELTSGGTWIKQPLQETKQTLSERLSQQASSRRKKRKPKATRSTAVEGAQTPKISSEDISLLVEVPPRPKLQRRFSQMRRQTQGTQGNLGKMDTTYPEQPQQASGGFSASKEAQTVEGTQQLPHQAPVSVSPPGRALPELAKAYSRLSLGSTGRRPRCDDSPYSGQAASSLLASSPRLTVPATGETLEKSGGTRAPEIRPVGSEEAPRSSWSRAWSPGSPFSRLYQATDQTTAAAAYATETVQGVSSQQPHPSKVGPQGNFMPPHASPPPSFPVTTSQSLASDAYEAIHSPRPQAPHMHMQNLVSLELAAASPVPSPTSSSLKRKETPQPIGVLISPVPEGSPADLHSVEQGMGGTKDSMGILPVVEVPPRPKHRFSLMRRQPPGTQGNLGKMDTTHPEQPQQASGGVSASNEAQSVEGTQQLPHQAPVSISPPPQALPEASSRLSLGSTGHQPRDDGSPYSGQAASSLLASSAQPTVTAAGETLEKSGGARDPETTRGTKDSMEGPSGLPSAPPSLPEFFKGRRAGDALEESPWLDSDSDSG